MAVSGEQRPEHSFGDIAGNSHMSRDAGEVTQGLERKGEQPKKSVRHQAEETPENFLTCIFLGFFCGFFSLSETL